MEYSTLLKFSLASLLVISAPGPAMLTVATQARKYPRLAASSVAGIVIGDVLWMSIAACGLGVLLAHWPWVTRLIRYFGGAYLVYLAVGMFRSDSLNSSSSSRYHRSTAWLRGLWVTLGNPKPVLFFATFFPSFIAPETQHQALDYLLFGVLFESINICFYLALISLMRYAKMALFGDAYQRCVAVVAAAGMLIFATMMFVGA